MKPKQKLFGPIEIVLTIALLVCSLAGVAYAGLSGIVAIPGLPVIFNSQPSNQTTQPPVAVPSTDTSSSLTDGSSTPSPTTPVTVSPPASISPVASPSVADSTPEPAAAATLDPQAALKDRDRQRKEDLAKLQVAIEQQKKKKGKYLIVSSYTESRTDKAGSPLQGLVSEGYLSALPTDPSTPDYWYAYRSESGTDYSLTARLENTTDPDGTYDEANNYLYRVAGP